MKTAFLAICLIGVAFAAPISEYVDPDCVEEDLTLEEPVADINAEFAIGVPDIVLDLNNNDEECEDDLFEPTEGTEATPQASTEAECEDEPIEFENVTEEPEFEFTEALPAAPEYSETADECEEETAQPE